MRLPWKFASRADRQQQQWHQCLFGVCGARGRDVYVRVGRAKRTSDDFFFARRGRTTATWHVSASCDPPAHTTFTDGDISVYCTIGPCDTPAAAEQHALSCTRFLLCVRVACMSPSPKNEEPALRKHVPLKNTKDMYKRITHDIREHTQEPSSFKSPTFSCPTERSEPVDYSSTYTISPPPIPRHQSRTTTTTTTARGLTFQT